MKRKIAGIILPSNAEILCPSCGEVSKLEEWDNRTLRQCTSREMRRDYTSLCSSKAFSKEKRKWYICPKCETCSAGNTLRVEHSDTKISELGGDSPIQF